MTIFDGTRAVDWNPARVSRGAAWGAVATVVMSTFMLLGVATGVSPMPKPIPVALAGRTLGPLTQPAAMGIGVLAHLAYGAGAGAVLAALVRPVNVVKGLGFGVLLWIVMGLVFLPYLGWGLFGTGQNVRIAGATLLLHLMYGATLGLTLDRQSP